ncbi:MAG TPA: DinB family protein [Cyclobacteriaceae bacterium]|nr:DinB family protein [Cyclobacteriaceae bacterium]
MKKHIQSTFDISKNYTLAVAEAMPDSSYNFKPAADVWTFNELINHIAYGIQWWEANYVKLKETKWDPPSGKANKKEAIKSLQQAFEGLQETLNTVKLNDDIVKGFYSTFDHISHHRGQATVFLRLKGIAPPDYVF